jgi:hypothetical protein
MARRSPPLKEQIDSTRSKIRGLLASPLRAVAEILGRTLEEAVCASEAGSLPPGNLRQLCSCISNLLAGLPQSYSERFFFDAAMIRALADDWDGSLRLSPMVIPLYGDAWGHSSMPMPSENRREAHLIDVIVFPGDDNIDDVNLLEYPWLAHELGHYILFRDDTPFQNAFLPALEKRLRSLKLSSIADRGSAKLKAIRIVDEVRKVWTPSPDHRNWAHELAIDIIALWTCGPAYLACFKNEVEQPGTNPYKITQEHPPYDVRLSALVDAAQNLGLDRYTEKLSEVRMGWVITDWYKKRSNRFLALADRTLIRRCVETALEFCNIFGLEKWRSSRIDAARHQVLDETSMELGVNLLLAARILLEERGERALDEWGVKIVRRIGMHVMQESR